MRDSPRFWNREVAKCEISSFLAMCEVAKSETVVASFWRREVAKCKILGFLLL